MTKEEARNKALDLFERIGEEIGDYYVEDNCDVWAALGMSIVLWVTYNAARGDVEKALKYCVSFHDKLRENVMFNVGTFNSKVQ